MSKIHAQINLPNNWFLEHKKHFNLESLSVPLEYIRNEYSKNAELCVFTNEIKPDIKSDIINIIIKWCYDDKDRNVLYKNTGEERYPEFKLYKMIARTVHNHKPCVVLENKHFSQYIVSNKSIKKYKNKIIDIDKLEPEY